MFGHLECTPKQLQDIRVTFPVEVLDRYSLVVPRYALCAKSSAGSTFYSITPQSEHMAMAQSTHWYFKGSLWALQSLNRLTAAGLTCCVEKGLLVWVMRWVGCSLPVLGGFGGRRDRSDALIDRFLCNFHSIFLSSVNTSWVLCNFFGKVNTIICPFK